MKSWRNRHTLLSLAVPSQSVKTAALQSLTDGSPPQINNTLNADADKIENPPPENIVAWLAQLTLLQGVPFEYLAPYNALLPTESIRFFYLDQNWQDRLIDGAISVGVASTQDNLFNTAWYEALYAEVEAQRGKTRTQMRGQSAPTITDPTISGFLFRSVVVDAWPGIEIEGSANGTALPILRMDRLSAGVLLCLFSGVPDQVKFIEPGEGLHFGLLDGTAGSSEVLVRGLGLPTTAPLESGVQIPNSAEPGEYITAPATFRSSDNEGVVDIAKLQTSIKTAITSAVVPGKPGDTALPDGKVTPAAFAIQMVRGAGLMNYQMPKEKSSQ